MCATLSAEILKKDKLHENTILHGHLQEINIIAMYTNRPYYW